MPDATTPYVLTASDMEATYDGISVCCSGEDGDMLALGHHDPTTALAAFDRHAREFLKIENVAADDTLTDAQLAEYAEDITQQWGVVRNIVEGPHTQHVSAMGRRWTNPDDGSDQ